MRRSMPSKADRRIFKRTAVKSKAINLYPVMMRGGIRL